MRISIIIILLVMPVIAFAQDAPVEKKQLEAIRISEAPKIDGKLDEQLWKDAPLVTDFVQKDPVPGGKPSQKTEVRMLYDDAALYIGAMLYDTSPDSVRRGLAQRDGIGDASYFGIFIDAYKSGIYGESFIVTSAGVQFDAKYSDNGEDENWSAVWKSQISFTDEGWIVEMKIPYSALRFPKKDVQEWYVNFQRRMRRVGEEVWWNELNPEVSGFFNQFGEVKTIKNINPPLRLFLFPYISYNVSHYPYNEADVNNWNRSFNAGMDIKYGINDAFTLDMTLIPDFGQTASDDQILNLNPFEVQFSERRQFFTEGTELFSKGDLFYSRRIGGTPAGYYDVIDEADANGETIVSNPSSTQLLNSTKISGRTKGGLGIGVFNSISARTVATLKSDNEIDREIETNPLSNYNVFVLDQNLKNNSSVTLINTNVWRKGEGDDNYEANVSGSLFRIANKKNSYEVSGGGAVSQKYFSGFDDVELGYQTYFSVGKIGGSLNAFLSHELVSDQYDHNDLGFLRRNNYSNFFGRAIYRKFQPFGKFLRAYAGTNMEYERLYKPSSYQDFSINPFYGGMFKNRLQFEHWIYTSPFGSKDYNDPRVEGRYYNMPAFLGSGLYISSDNTKKIRLSIFGSAGVVDDNKRYFYDFGIEPSIIISDKWRMDYEFSYRYGNNDTGWADELDNDDIIFGRRNLNTYVNVFNTSYIFTNKMGLTLRARHYWSRAEYQSYFLLGLDGDPEATTYDGLDEEGLPANDINYNSVNVDLIYTWEFLPGSQLSLVWKNNINTFKEDTDFKFINNFTETITGDQSNLFSVKVLYFLDYLSLQRKKERATISGKSVPIRKRMTHSRRDTRKTNEYLKTVL